MNDLNNLLGDLSPIVTVTAVVWAITEITKYLVGRAHDRQRKLFDPGGMPSVHSSVIVCATVTAALADGIGSPVFGLGVVVSAIVLHDAFRVRWSVGEQGRVLNKLAKRAKEEQVVVFRGHRLREVIAGSAYGGLLAYGVYQLFYG